MPQHQPLRGSRILIAEDDAVQAFDLKMLFEANGAQVVGPARTLMSALALANAAGPTCAVLDIVLGHETRVPRSTGAQGARRWPRLSYWRL
jgi:DNA-binding response OmpR family regulator